MELSLQNTIKGILRWRGVPVQLATLEPSHDDRGNRSIHPKEPIPPALERIKGFFITSRNRMILSISPLLKSYLTTGTLAGIIESPEQCHCRILPKRSTHKLKMTHSGSTKQRQLRNIYSEILKNTQKKTRQRKTKVGKLYKPTIYTNLPRRKIIIYTKIVAKVIQFQLRKGGMGSIDSQIHCL